MSWGYKPTTGSATGLKTGPYIMSKLIEDGKVIAREIYADLTAKSAKWKSRNVPIYIRESLWVPYYLTEVAGETRLFTIRPPDATNPKVHFREFIT